MEIMMRAAACVADDKPLHELQFDRIHAAVGELASCPLGCDRVFALAPRGDRGAIEAWTSPGPREIDRRTAEIDAGTARLVSWDEVKRRARARVRGKQ
jgi:hypothetical protein